MAHQAYLTTPLPAYELLTSENSPSKGPAADQPFIHFISMETVVSADSLACPAPLTVKLALGSAWKVELMARSGLKSCAQAARPRSVRIAFGIAHDLSARMPSSLLLSVTLFAP